MASIKHETDAWVREVSNAIQAIKKDVVGSNVHLDKCERSITAANATDLATSLALAKKRYNVGAIRQFIRLMQEKR
jgi:hypothetical protein